MHRHVVSALSSQPPAYGPAHRLPVTVPASPEDHDPFHDDDQSWGNIRPLRSTVVREADSTRALPTTSGRPPPLSGSKTHGTPVVPETNAPLSALLTAHTRPLGHSRPASPRRVARAAEAAKVTRAVEATQAAQAAQTAEATVADATAAAATETLTTRSPATNAVSGTAVQTVTQPPVTVLSATNKPGAVGTKSEIWPAGNPWNIWGLLWGVVLVVFLLSVAVWSIWYACTFCHGVAQRTPHHAQAVVRQLKSA